MRKLSRTACRKEGGMNILALDGSGLTAGIAVLNENVILAEYNVNYKKTHSQTLLPMVEEVMNMLRIKPEELDYIAVTSGPGSFTGLRIGASVAKGLGLALDKPLVPVPTTEALSYNFQGTDKLICPIMDARRNQVYYGIYKFEKEDGKTEEEAAIGADDIKNVIAKVNECGREVIFLGDGVEVYEKIIREETKVPFVLAPKHSRLQRAASLGIAAVNRIKEGKIVDAMHFVPEYYRLSQAERERNEKMKK